MRYTFKCSDTSCGRSEVLTLSAKGNITSARMCSSCHKQTLLRDLLADIATTQFNQSASNYGGRFPYVSNAFPFSGRGAKHHGRLNKCVIESKEHEAKMRRMHGYVGEEKACFTDEIPQNQTIFPKSKMSPKERALREQHLTPKALEALNV